MKLNTENAIRHLPDGMRIFAEKASEYFTPDDDDNHMKRVQMLLSAALLHMADLASHRNLLWDDVELLNDQMINIFSGLGVDVTPAINTRTPTLGTWLHSIGEILEGTPLEGDSKVLCALIACATSDGKFNKLFKDADLRTS